MPTFELRAGRVHYGEDVLDLPHLLEVVARLSDEGANGEVFKAIDHQLPRQVALKIWRRPVRKERVNRAQSEARKLASINHPLIVTVYQFGLARGFPFATMELIQGKTLKSWIGVGSSAFQERSTAWNETPLWNETAFDNRYAAWRMISGALRVAYRRGIYHGDPHWKNVLVFEDDTGLFQTLHGSERASPKLGLKVTDFGSSRLGQQAQAQLSRRESRTLIETVEHLFEPEPSRPRDVMDLRSNMLPEATLAALDAFVEYLDAFQRIRGAPVPSTLGEMDLIRIGEILVTTPLARLPTVLKEIKEIGVSDSSVKSFFSWTLDRLVSEVVVNNDLRISKRLGRKEVRSISESAKRASKRLDATTQSGVPIHSLEDIPEVQLVYDEWRQLYLKAGLPMIKLSAL